MCPNRAGGSPILGKDSAAAAAGAFAVPTAEGKKGRHLRFLPSLNTHFPCNHSLGADGRLRKQEKGNGRGFLLPRGITPFRISAAVLLHPIWVCAGAAQGELPVGQERVPWGIAVPRNSLARCNARHLRIKHLVQFILVGAVYHNALTNCAALLCRACVE